MTTKNPMTESSDNIPSTTGLSGPASQAAWTLSLLNKDIVGADATTLYRELVVQIETINCGDLKEAEARLTAQATTLDALFHNLMRRGLHQKEAYYPGDWERILRLALKAQSQCRVTIESLAALKNPQSVAYVKQANIAHTQQVNNAVTVQDLPEGRG